MEDAASHTRDSRTGRPVYFHSRGSSIAASVLGGALLLLLVAILFIFPEPSTFQRDLIRFFAALDASFLSFFFVGGIVLRGRIAGVGVGAGGGFVVFVMLMSVIDPFSAKTAVADLAPSVLISDETVARAQRDLRTRGLFDGKITGIPDTATRSAIKSFQLKAHLPANGYVDDVTASALADRGGSIDQPIGNVILPSQYRVSESNLAVLPAGKEDATGATAKEAHSPDALQPNGNDADATAVPSGSPMSLDPENVSTDPRVPLGQLIQAFQNCVPSPVYLMLGSELYQTVWTQTGGSGCYPTLRSAGPVQQMQIADQQAFPKGVVYAIRVIHAAGVMDWFIGINRFTGKVEYLSYHPAGRDLPSVSAGMVNGGKIVRAVPVDSGAPAAASSSSSVQPSSKDAGDVCSRSPTMC